MSSRTVVVGGGLAGVAAAVALAERGEPVTLLEKEPFLGGRAGSWPDRLADGTPFQMERGLHAFFRNYDNVRSLIRRVDPELRCLMPLEDYPLLVPGEPDASFAGLPTTTPFNVAALLARSPHVSLRDLAQVDLELAREMLAFDPERTYRTFDDQTAAAFLDALRFPEKARRVLFDVFAHSFFNPEADYSAAELLAMFHFYFTGNPRGLVFDVVTEPFGVSLFEPLRRYLEAHGARVVTGVAASHVEGSDGAWCVVGEATTDGGAREPFRVEAHDLVLGLAVPALREVVAASPALAPLGAGVASLEVTAPFVVLRLWLDRPCRPDRAPFAAMAGYGILDNVSLFDRLEGESRAWATRTGGSVVELHAYAIEGARSPEDLRQELIAQLHRVYPETQGATIVEERLLVREDCPAFRPGSHASRPTVRTPLTTVQLAGDFVRLDVPSALMERAVTSGFLAASAILARKGLASVPVSLPPRRGLLAGLSRRLDARVQKQASARRADPPT